MLNTFKQKSNSNNLKDLHLVDLEEFKYSGTNITSFRLVDPHNPKVEELVKSWNIPIKGSKGRIDKSNFKVNILSLLSATFEFFFVFLKTAIALMYDAVHVFAKALDQLDQSQARVESFTHMNKSI